MDNLKRTIGQRVKLLRSARHLSQEQLAEEIGRGISSISKLERGIMMPGIDTLVLLAGALNCSLDDFVRPLEDAAMKAKGRGERAHLDQEAWAVLANLDNAELKAVISTARAISELHKNRF
ncbi:MAG TPA: XRE family transcriptional regulator [Alphaproteobacteria bacterium]|uniref:helix-turn-helix domain-containing protein n=1 Tax=Kordiimonas sp. TaxID=1970157 RepID=UPI001A159307|nr:XRE family transcriptional regulator [Alphaproteobacteria bacterium]